MRILGLVSLLAVVPVATATADLDGDYIRLVAALDEPEFYCIDIAGWGEKIQLDDPLQTHTCKSRSADDQMFRFADGRLQLSRYDRCVQIAGSSGKILAGSAVLARSCSDDPLQQLSLDATGRIRVGSSEFCLASGADSAEASGPSHLWRTLTVADCDQITDSLITWQIGLADN